jgi:hypothetical protein
VLNLQSVQRLCLVPLGSRLCDTLHDLSETIFR